ncbi:MAG: hypothetical protein ACSHX6_03905 [Akkermansiaceae bacterium]
MKTNVKTDQTCELIQLSISDAIDTNENLTPSDAQHIATCQECAEFHQAWSNDSNLTSIASGHLIDQQNLTLPIISQLKQHQESNLIRGKFFKVASIAAIIAIATTFTFLGDNQDKPQDDIADNIEVSSKDQLSITIPKIEINLTEADIEQSIEENFQQLSNAATDKWKTATTSISNATEYIANGTHYISNKYLAPSNDTPSGPQTQLIPQRVLLSPLHYG